MKDGRGMRPMLRWCLGVSALASGAALLINVPTSKAAPVQVMEFKGICNASAGVALTDDLFVIADDEDKVVTKKLKLKSLPFRVYSLSQPGWPILIGDLPGNDIDPVIAEKVSGELDLEASAPLDGVVFWIGSHSAGSGDKPARTPNRRRLFAVRFNLQGSQLIVKREGRTYSTLLEDLAKNPNYAQFKIMESATIDPKNPGDANSLGGLSIEGLTALPGGSLAIGFRNPVYNGKALVATLLNPMQVLAGQQARYDEPILLDLDGQGIRSMATLQDNVLVVGGPAGEPVRNSQGTGSKPPHQLYRWPGNVSTRPKPQPQLDLSGLFVEAVFPVGNKLLAVSDDGKMKLPMEECQKLSDEQKRFRAIAVPLPVD